MFLVVVLFFFFFFTDTAPTEIYTLSLHDALPISPFLEQLFSGVDKIDIFLRRCFGIAVWNPGGEKCFRPIPKDRKSTRLNSSHSQISYAVFCLKKKKIQCKIYTTSYHINVTSITP